MGVLGSHLRWWFLLASGPMVALVFFRGLVGVDTPVYEQSIDLIRSSGTYTFTFEPLFEYAILLISNQIDDVTVVLAVFSALTTLLFFVGAFQIKQQPYIYAFFLMPYFYLDMTMNGIRAGLAFVIILCGANFLVNGRRKYYVVFALIAALIHISSALLAVLLIVLLDQRLRALLWSVGIGFILIIFFESYLTEKFYAYQTINIESGSGGLAPLLLSGLLLVNFYSDKEFRDVSKWQLQVLGVISVATYVITQFTYAGIRLQILNLFLICIFLVSFIDLKKIKINQKTLFVLFLIGLVGMGFRLRNFYNEAGNGEAPFVPYHFSWER